MIMVIGAISPWGILFRPEKHGVQWNLGKEKIPFSRPAPALTRRNDLNLTQSALSRAVRRGEEIVKELGPSLVAEGHA
jgi:hypothetical protein